MQNARASAQSWNVTESGSGLQITARCEYREDKLNAVIADYTYLITPAGTLKVALKTEPKMDVPWLPEIGVEFKVALQTDRLTWLGPGPLDSLPNKLAATTFGLWSAKPGSDDARGTKSMIEWASLSYENGAHLHIEGGTGIRLETAADKTQRLRVFTNLAGAWTKNGPPERPEWRLDVAAGKTFNGSFEITPVAPVSAGH